MASRARTAGVERAGDVMTVDQVAAYLQLNRLTVYRYVREGKIPAARIGKLYRILRTDVDQFLEARRAEPNPAGTKAPRHRADAHLAAPAPRPSTSHRARSPKDVYVGPTWRERCKDRDRATRTDFPLESMMTGLN